MNKSLNNNIKKIRPRKVILPIFLGLGIVGWFIYRDFDKIEFSALEFSYYSLLFIGLAFLMMILRDLGYIVRLRILSSNELSWLKCLRIILLWEFGSAITPSAVGGTAIATIFIWKEGLTLGKSTSIVVATSFLDELYFSLMFPLIFIIFSRTELFHVVGSSFLADQFLLLALIGYGVKLLWTILMGYSIFINPRFMASIVRRFFKFRFLRKWKNAANNMAENFEISNREFKTKNFKFWLKASFASFISWTSRYWVLNFLLIALYYSLKYDVYAQLLSVQDHFLIFAKQLIMWIMMLVMPTPGGSGFVETIFNSYMVEFVPVTGFVVIMALVWRMVTYYPYLFIGVFLAPAWVNKNFKKIKLKKRRTEK
ncbi:MAG: lysylphosphatidylglycerol synthase transmembrane domain-containing protein [Bacteroidales bacterium]|nr:lysylphosphatidylglycerol synthase transmembrane domain-containing protein [Bacteroidales bacterium]